MIINADQELIQESLDDGDLELDDVIAAFCELAAVLRSNGQDPSSFI